VSLSEISRLHLVQIFNDGDRLLAEAERMELQGIVSKRRAAPYKSGNSRDWIKVETNAWRETNKLR
jgi:ATP-dependent DNA ligase